MIIAQKETEIYGHSGEGGGEAHPPNIFSKKKDYIFVLMSTFT